MTFVQTHLLYLSFHLKWYLSVVSGIFTIELNATDLKDQMNETANVLATGLVNQMTSWR